MNKSGVPFVMRQPYDINRTFVLVVATIMLGVHLGHNAFLSQLGLPADSALSAWQNRHFYYLGVMFAQPTILAAWTWYGRGSLAGRIKWSTLIAFMLGNAALYGAYVNQGQEMTIADLSITSYPVIQYAIVLGLLAIIARSTQLPTPHRESRPQVALKEAFSWTAVLATGLGGMSAILHSSTVTGVFDLSLVFALLLVPMFMALMSAPIIATILIILGTSQNSALKWSFIFLILQQAILLTMGSFTPLPIIDVLLAELVILIAMHATAAATALPFRACHAVVTPTLRRRRAVEGLDGASLSE